MDRIYVHKSTTGQAYISGNDLIIRGPQGPTGEQGPTGDPGPGSNIAASYYSTVSEPVNTTPITFSYNATFLEVGGITRSGTRINIPSNGVYEVWYSAEVERVATGTASFIYFWLARNGVYEPETNSRIETNSNNRAALPIVPYILNLNAGDYIEFFTVADRDGVYTLQASVSPPSEIALLSAVPPIPSGIPNIPSVIVGIKKIATAIGSTTVYNQITSPATPILVSCPSVDVSTGASLSSTISYNVNALNSLTVQFYRGATPIGLPYTVSNLSANENTFTISVFDSGTHSAAIYSVHATTATNVIISSANLTVNYS